MQCPYIGEGPWMTPEVTPHPVICKITEGEAP